MESLEYGQRFVRKMCLCDCESTGECKSILPAHNGDVYCMYLDKMNGNLFSGGLDATAAIWDLKARKSNSSNM